MPKPKDLERHSHISGVPIHYARAPVAPYGSQGEPRRPRCVPSFYKKLQAWMDYYAKVCPLGRPTILVTAGMYVDKPGAHGLGRAIDIDSLWFLMHKGLPAPIITKSAPKDSGRYLATEAVLRMFFGTVINYWTNRSHRDHWHIDDVGRYGEVGFMPDSSSEVAFVQASCLYVHGQDIGPTGLDKEWGPKTRAAVSRVLGVDMRGKWSLRTDKHLWLQFLRETFTRGWKLAEDPFEEAGWPPTV